MVEPHPPMVEPVETRALSVAVEEIEAHVADDGWDQPARLYALARTRDLVVREPGLAEALGLTGDPDEIDDDALTPVEQEHVPVDRSLEEVLEAITWPAEVFGCAVVVERVVLPPEADDDLPTDPAEAETFAANHPQREEVRMIAAVDRDGGRWSALRLRSHDEAKSVMTGPDLVPGLLDLLTTTLVD